MNNLEIDFISDQDVAKIVNYIFSNIGSPKKISHVNLFNEFHEKRIRDIIGRALLDENYVMKQEKDKDYSIEAKFILTQLKLANLRKKRKEIESKIKSANQYTPETRELMQQQQKLKVEEIELEKQLRGK
jgi:hypothetical protein